MLVQHLSRESAVKSREPDLVAERSDCSDTEMGRACIPHGGFEEWFHNPDWLEASDPVTYAICFNCQTQLVDTFRTRFPELTYQGNRAIHLCAGQPLPRDPLGECIALALTYHRDKKLKVRK